MNNDVIIEWIQNTSHYFFMPIIRKDTNNNMNNQTISEKINNYFSNDTPVEETVKTYMLNMLANFSSDKIECLQIEDNTLNGIDIEKNSWRAHFVNLTTEEDFYIEVSITQSGIYKSRCFSIDDNDNVKLIK